MPSKKECPICFSHVNSFLTSPNTCLDQNGQSISHSEKTGERACGECWELWLSKQVEERPIADSRGVSSAEHLTSMPCIFCLSPLSEEELLRLSKKHTNDRYHMKKAADSWRVCQNRCQGTRSLSQPFSRSTDGRVFVCQYCSFKTCVDCDRPEHVNETCLEYQARMSAVHTASEMATRLRADLPDAKILGYCPNCSVPFDGVEKACGHVTCSAGSKMSSAGVSAGCGFRFCSGCLVPWVGSGSVYLKGRLAHLPSCKHYFHLCSACNRKEHPNETCDEYASRLKPIADAADRKNKCAPGERHWETSHGALNRFEMSRTYLEREEAKRARKRSAKTSQRGESKKLKTEA